MRIKYRFMLIILLFFLSIGFAVLTSNLDITGNTIFADASFNVHFENAVITNKNIDDGSIIIDNNSLIINFTGTFEKPGNYINASFYVKNSGTMDAQIGTLTVTGLTTELKDYFSYTLKYDVGGANVSRGDILRAGQGRKVNLHIEYKYDVENLTSASSLNLSFAINYINPQKAITSTTWNYEYTGGEQIFYANKEGNYKIEVWGAQGGYGYTSTYRGGYGGYSTGKLFLNKNDLLYIYVGGNGVNGLQKNTSLKPGGYNGGGSDNGGTDKYVGSGGGATHVALVQGELRYLENSKDKIIIVAGGGGGGGYEKDAYYCNGGNGGGYLGSISTVFGADNFQEYTKGSGGTQLGGGTGVYSGSFGKGADFLGNGIGGGAGYYGGGAGLYSSGGGGGSGYIGYQNLTDKIMYCYNCQSSENEEDETHIKTRSTTNVSATATSNYAKIGDGFVRITYLGNS